MSDTTAIQEGLPAKFEVLVTAIIFNPFNEILLTRRTMNKKRFPGMWTVPGGHLELDYMKTDSAYDGVWYNIIEKACIREVKEETGLDIENVSYLRSIGMGDNLIISCVAEANFDYKEITLQADECDEYAWVKPMDAVNYKLIGPIYPQIVEAAFIRGVD